MSYCKGTYHLVFYFPVEAYSSQNAKIARTFDPEAQIFPIGFQHNTSLINIPTLSGIRGVLKYPHTTGWLSKDE